MLPHWAAYSEIERNQPMRIVNSESSGHAVDVGNSIMGNRPVRALNSMIVMLPKSEIEGRGIVTIGGDSPATSLPK
jgi:hypothetical protein